MKIKKGEKEKDEELISELKVRIMELIRYQELLVMKNRNLEEEIERKLKRIQQLEMNLGYLMRA
jgi:hypothetical protein